MQSTAPPGWEVIPWPPGLARIDTQTIPEEFPSGLQAMQENLESKEKSEYRGSGTPST